MATFYFSNANHAFGYKAAQKLLPNYVVSAGCFAMSARAPHWERWQELATEAARKWKVFTAEQLALGVLVWLEGHKIELLPSYNHWIAAWKMRFDETRGEFVEGYLPHERIGVLHLSGVNAMRQSRDAKAAYETTEGHVVHLNCRYPDFDGGAVFAVKRA